MPNVAAAVIWPLSLASSRRASVTGSMAAPCHHWKTACVFNRSSLGTECVGYETKASNETRRMALAARGCPTRSVPACLRPRDWHADRAVHPRPFGHYCRSRDPSPAPMSGGRKRLFRENENVWTRMSVMLSQDDHWVGHAITYGCRRKVGVSLGTKA